MPARLERPVLGLAVRIDLDLIGEQFIGEGAAHARRPVVGPQLPLPPHPVSHKAQQFDQRGLRLRRLCPKHHGSEGMNTRLQIIGIISCQTGGFLGRSDGVPGRRQRALT